MACACFLLLALPAAAHASLPANFVLDDVTPSSAFLFPTGIAFLPDGRLLVAEKNGDLWAVQGGVKPVNPMWSSENEVLSNHDKGLLDVAVDPNYFVNHYVYLLLTVDPDSDGTDTNTVAFARLSRFTVNFTDSQTVIPSSRAVLLGVDWSHGPPTGSTTHTIGSLRWGSDGTLLVSVGDGADGSSNMDPGGQYPALFGVNRANPYEDIGAFRAQSLSSLDGKILRINPANGQGYASNPYYDGNLSSFRSRVYAYGFRNPFRFNLKPGTGSTNPADGNPGILYVDDVGWYTWEEVNVVKQPGQNFGWPCYEGLDPNGPYQAATPSHNGCGSFGTADNPTLPTLPIVSINHDDPSASTPAGIQGNAITGCAFYTGTHYPAQYRNTYFFCDFGQNWMKELTTDANDQLVSVAAFGDTLDGPVNLITDPVSGDLYYVSIYDGKVFHVRYTIPLGVGNQPVATIVLSNARPNPTGSAVRFALDLPTRAQVSFAVCDVMGREVYREAPRDLEAGQASLGWSGRLAGGAAARPGVYLARVTVNGRAFIRRFAIVR
jgi:glucose/arabinose dehydrogenase